METLIQDYVSKAVANVKPMMARQSEEGVDGVYAVDGTTFIVSREGELKNFGAEIETSKGIVLFVHENGENKLRIGEEEKVLEDDEFGNNVFELLKVKLESVKF